MFSLSKTLILCSTFTVLLTTVGCTSGKSSLDSGQPSPSPINPAPPVKANDTGEGGVNGGGGGTLPADQMRPSEIRDIVQKSKKTLNLFVKGELYLAGVYPEIENSYTCQKKLFGGKPNLWDVLQNVDLELEMDKPCYDSFGNEVDGSVHATKPNTICISAFRTAPKLIAERA